MPGRRRYRLINQIDGFQLTAAAVLAGLPPGSWLDDSRPISARLIAACRVAEVIFAPNRSVT